MDALRRHRRPVTAQELADEQAVSVRTLYRDIQTLIGLGAPIDGEAGIGYMLKPGFFLPPLMFTPEELEALVLGAQWVEGQPDDGLTGGGAQRARQDRDGLAGRSARPAVEHGSVGGARRSGRAVRTAARHRPRGDAQRKDAASELCRRGRQRDAAAGLAGDARLLRRKADRRRLVHDAEGFPQFPRRPDQGREHRSPSPTASAG